MHNEGKLSPNVISDFVVENLASYNDLNAPTLEEADDKFKKALKQILEKKQIGEKKGRGGQLLVNAVQGVKGLVVKRLEAAGELPLRGDRTLDEYWQYFKSEHELVSKHFGPRFVPHTEFVEIENNMGDPDPFAFLVLNGKEYIMVQEEIEGENLFMFDKSIDKSIVSPELKLQMKEFLRRYERLMREEKMVIEDQIVVNSKLNTIKVTDTNHLISFNELVNVHGKPFLKKYGIDPQKMTTASEIIQAICEHVPEMSSLRTNTYSEIISELHSGSTLYFDACSSLMSLNPDNNFKNSVYESFKSLVRAVKYFPPEHEHNVVVKNMMVLFGIDEL